VPRPVQSARVPRLAPAGRRPRPSARCRPAAGPGITVHPRARTYHRPRSQDGVGPGRPRLL